MDLYQLFVRISGDNSSFKSAMKDSQADLATFETTTEASANRIAAIGTKLMGAIGFGALGAGALAAAKKFEDASVQIQRSTGATGDKLDSLEKSFAAVYAQVPKSAEQVTAALTVLSTRTDTTGKSLEALTVASLKLANIHKEDAGTIIPAVTQMFGAWSVATSKQAASLDYLRVVSQQSGATVGTLTTELVSQAPVLQKLGYSYEQAAALIGQFDKSGVLAQGGMTAFRRVIASFAKDNVDAASGWATLTKGIQDGTVSLADFQKLAGARGGALPLFQAIKDHKTDVDGLATSYVTMAAKGVDSVNTIGEKFTLLQHQVEGLVSAHRDLIIVLGMTYPAWSGLAIAGGSAIGALVTRLIGAGGAAAAIATVSNSTYMLGGTFTATGATMATAGATAAIAWAWLWAPVAGVGLLLAGQLGIQKAAQSSNPKIVGAAVGLNAGLSAAGIGSPFSMGQDLSGTPVAREAMGPPQAPPGSAPPAAAAAPGIPTYLNFTTMAQAMVVEKQKEANAEFGKTLQYVTDWYSGMGKVATVASKIPAYLTDSFGAPMIADLKNPLEADAAAFDKCDKIIKETGKDIGAMAVAGLANDPYGRLADSAKYFGLTSTGEYAQIAKTAIEKYDQMEKSGKATFNDLAAAALKTAQAEIDADHAAGKMTDARYAADSKAISADLALYTGAEKKKQTLQEQIATETTKLTNSMFNSMERGLASDIVHWKGFGQTVTDVFQKMGEDILTIMLHALLKPVEKLFADVLSGIAEKLLAVFITQKVAAAAVDSGQVASEAAVGGAAAAASIAAIPIVGPAMALEAGMGMYAAILGTFQPLVLAGASAAGGFGDIPANMLVQTHAKEMILPADIATPLRAQLRNGGMGSGGFTLNIGTMQGVAKETVNLLANQIIRGARLSGARI